MEVMEALQNDHRLKNTNESLDYVNAFLDLVRLVHQLKLIFFVLIGVLSVLNLGNALIIVQP